MNEVKTYSHAKEKKFYRELVEELTPVLGAIILEKQQLINLKKPILNPDTKYGNRILACIAHFCNLKRPTTTDLEYYMSRENMEFEYTQILDVNYFINCTNGIDYIFSKKLVCMMLGISIVDYQEMLNFNYESSVVFRSIDELLIASRQESAENFNRNAIAIDNTLKTKGKYGGYEVEVKQENNNDNTNTKFDAINASFEEVKKYLTSKYNMPKIDVE